MVHDLVIDTFFEEGVVAALASLGAGRLIMDPDSPDDPFLTKDDGYLVVRLRDRDPIVFSRELEKRVPMMRIVTVVDRTPQTEGAHDGHQ